MSKHDPGRVARLLPDHIAPRMAAAVPWCSESACPSFDGKRCQEIGQRPWTICEPAVQAMSERLAVLAPAPTSEGG